MLRHRSAAAATAAATAAVAALALAACPHPAPAPAPAAISSVPPATGSAVPPPVDAVAEPLVDRPLAMPVQLPPLPPATPSATPPAATVVAATSPPSPRPAAPAAIPTDRDVERLRRQIAGARSGRIALRDRLADALDRRAAAVPNTSTLVADAIRAGDDLLADPDFQSYAEADHALFRQGQLLIRAGRAADARRALLVLIKDYPASELVPDVYLVFGDYYFDAADLDSARRFYEKVLQFPSAAVASYARYKLGWVHLNLGDGAAALEAFVRVAGDASRPMLRRAALHDAVRAYAMIGKPDKAIAFFTRVDPGDGLALVAELGRIYLDQGKAAEAMVTLTAVADREPDPDRACQQRVTVVEAALMAMKPADILDAAARLADAARGSCRARADQLLGELAWTWHAELVRSHAPGRDVRRAWDLAAAVVTTPERAAAIAVNRAEAAWHQHRDSRAAADWIDVAEAFHAAAGAAGDPALDEAAVDAWSNAATTAGHDGRIDGAVAARIRAGLATVDGPAAPRARALAARLR